jgi:hypothetical protein
MIVIGKNAYNILFYRNTFNVCLLYREMQKYKNANFIEMIFFLVLLSILDGTFEDWKPVGFKSTWFLQSAF